MFGIDNISVWLAYVLCIASALLCVIYGLIAHNRGKEAAKAEDFDWVKEEKELENEL